jgi:predicted GNAT family acetyltransferase
MAWLLTQRLADFMTAYGGITLWEDGGRPVSMASVTSQVAGVCRVGSVYTPPRYRHRGYGGAVTTAASRRALDRGAAAMVLYADLANPTSNALYQRIGYRPVCDRVAVELRQACHSTGDSAV